MNVSTARATPASSLVSVSTQPRAFQFGDRVAHDDGRTGELEHLDVVEVVTDRHDFVARVAPRPRPVVERGPLAQPA